MKTIIIGQAIWLAAFTAIVAFVSWGASPGDLSADVRAVLAFVWGAGAVVSYFAAMHIKSERDAHSRLEEMRRLTTERMDAIVRSADRVSVVFREEEAQPVARKRAQREN